MNKGFAGPMGSVVGSAANVFGILVRNHYLAWQLTKRGVLARYSGSMLGIAWSFVQPLFMLGLYSFVFSVVMKARWPDVAGAAGQERGGLAYTVMLFAGLIVHGMFAECLGRAPGLVAGTPSYVKKMVFPLEVLPWTVVGVALTQAAISLSILAALAFELLGGLPATALFLPLVVAPYLIFLLGVLWIVSAFGVFFRDLEQIVGMIATVALFFSPVLFPVSAMPDMLQPYVWLNPLSFIIEEVRGVLLMGRMPNFGGLALYTLLAFLFAWGSSFLFLRLRRAFADVV